MRTALEILELEALKLPPSELARLLERLIASLDADLEVEAAWEREADRREAELDAVLVTEVSGPEAIARLRARLAVCVYCQTPDPSIEKTCDGRHLEPSANP